MIQQNNPYKYLKNEVKNGFGRKKFQRNGRSILVIMTHNQVRVLLFIKLISLTELLGY